MGTERAPTSRLAVRASPLALRRPHLASAPGQHCIKPGGLEVTEWTWFSPIGRVYKTQNGTPVYTVMVPMHRKPSFYLKNVALPSVFISAMSFSVLLIPINKVRSISSTAPLSLFVWVPPKR